ncbi:hypothetical protein GGR56DRAFT_643569 [Xylariaceae sp. FL0804]|nr:hypothetical protein GGR56DRAFT_643569 [Xylariaceae sp. FL0804]
MVDIAAESFALWRYTSVTSNQYSYTELESGMGSFEGLCFVYYPMTLAHRVKMLKPFDVDGCQQGIKADVGHMHEHGLTHNDLNP